MKYMGSKRAMLRNGLGELIDRELDDAGRFIDLFTGSASVAAHVASNYRVQVGAFDIQTYSVATAEAMVRRRTPLGVEAIWADWFRRASAHLSSQDIPTRFDSARDVTKARAWSSQQDGPITSAYGGHYFSALQATWFDALRKSLPSQPAHRAAALAALIEAASQCAAAPGHTAQPFQPTPTALKFLKEAWLRDAVEHTRRALADIGQRTAKSKGFAKLQDANVAARKLIKADLVFIDPPYSGVHYSRFYHVLETVAEGECGPVSGRGRYPATSKRPRSQYSMKASSARALDDLLQSVAQASATAILTFPDHECSNGLSGDEVRAIAARHLIVDHKSVHTRFSTLGGHDGSPSRTGGRSARRQATEMILVLRPKPHRPLAR